MEIIIFTKKIGDSFLNINFHEIDPPNNFKFVVLFRDDKIYFKLTLTKKPQVLGSPDDTY